MKWIHRISISLTVVIMTVACGVVLLFHWHAFGWQALSVPTGSMRPGMPPGSLVLVHRVPLQTLKVGDVITYANPEKMNTTITHRIIKTEMISGKVPAYKTKGDANPSADPWTVVGGLVQGEAMFHVPHVGGWLLWSKKPLGLLALIYIPAIFMMAEEVKRMSDYLKTKQPYKMRGYSGKVVEKSSGVVKKFEASAAIGVVLVLVSAAIAFPAEALLKSNTVSLGPNTLTVAKSSGGGGGNKCSSNNNINISNNNNQTASSGNANVNGNTTGGSATSGSATNNNNTTITITTTGC